MMKLLVVHEWTDVLVRASRKQWPLNNCLCVPLLSRNLHRDNYICNFNAETVNTNAYIL